MNADPTSRRFGIRFDPVINTGNILSAVIIAGGILGVYIKTNGDIVNLDSRVGVLERAMVERRSEERDAVSEIKKQLDELLRAFYDFKVQQAGQRSGGR
jgi:hypothetical protein